MSPQELPPAAHPAGAGAAAMGAAQPMDAEQAGGGGSGGSGVLVQLDVFLEAQRERAAAYRRFDASLRSYLATAAEGPYRHTMGQLTETFQALSQRVRAAEAALAADGHTELAALLRTVQDNEREKLRLTLALHALKSAHAQRRFSWQHDEAAPGLGGHVCGVGCMHDAPPDEPTQAEYTGAVQETYQLLQAAVTAINDALDEARQARADLLEQ